MNTGVDMPSTPGRRTVELTWVPVADPSGHVTMEMRWHVEDRPAAG